eukprot:TRINITY_DN18762_c0_g1_i1.p1 TRINITY_DN18762_c0_g1~~TRINITY_DN18762_c0_g1_i1.p1  ORF type:complete len:287 (+),score=57.82 TRINITY_DN18762_c0_g1_i1:129-989(+)
MCIRDRYQRRVREPQLPAMGNRTSTGSQFLTEAAAASSDGPCPLSEPLPPRPSMQAPDPTDRLPIVREELFSEAFPRGSMYVLHNVLSEAECQYYIHYGREVGYREVRLDYRSCDRLQVDSESLAKQIFERVSPFLSGDYLLEKDAEGITTASVDGVTQQGVQTDELLCGVWSPVEINKRFRLCKYDGAGVFQPHYDYGYKPNKTKSSIQTFMLYLDAPDGADTVVYTEAQKHYEQPKEENVIGRLAPRPGMAIVFNPRITHAGDPVKAGDVKHILRTEIMYQHMT